MKNNDFNRSRSRHPGDRRRGNKRGDVRAATLLLLAERPMHGYQLIQEISERSNSIWTPSPGSIYPVLQQLEDEGLVSFERVDGRKTATLTEAGTTYIEEKREELGIPWEAVTEQAGAGHREIQESLRGLMMAWKQIAQIGTPDQRKQAIVVLDDARKAMYRILAGDEQTS